MSFLGAEFQTQVLVLGRRRRKLAQGSTRRCFVGHDAFALPFETSEHRPLVAYMEELLCVAHFTHR